MLLWNWTVVPELITPEALDSPLEAPVANDPEVEGRQRYRQQECCAGSREDLSVATPPTELIRPHVGVERFNSVAGAVQLAPSRRTKEGPLGLPRVLGRCQGQAVNAQIDSPELSTLAAGKASIDVTTFEDGQESGGFNAALPPLAFLVIFYALIILLAGQMLSSTLEEKENKVTEMILTTLNPTTLISGKVLALFGVGAVQILVFASPFIIGYLFFREQVSIPDFDLTALVFEPVPMIIGALLLIGGFALFTTTLVAIGAVMPTAKEAGNFMGVMMARSSNSVFWAELWRLLTNPATSPIERTAERWSGP